MKTYRKGQKVKFKPLYGVERVETGVYMGFDGLCHEIKTEDKIVWRVMCEDIITVRSRRKYKQPPVWAKFL